MPSIIIFFILLFRFRRINMALLIMAAHHTYATQATGHLAGWGGVSVTAVLGIVMGILVRNGIIMLDYAEELRQVHKMSVFDAALQAGKRRMRPIFLTSTAASVGVVHLILGKSSCGCLWVRSFPGTLISMVLVVTVLPVAYWMLFRKADRKGVQRMAANS
ncbi:MAG: efflux RND transporter permease subunit [Bacteroides graminisolvens]